MLGRHVNLSTVCCLLLACSSAEGPGQDTGPDAATADLTISDGAVADRGGILDAGVDGGADALTDAEAGDAAEDAGLADSGQDGGQDCAQNELPLLLRNFGDTDRYYVAVTLEGRDVALQLDTGSGLTFLFTGSGTPNYTPVAGQIAIGCEDIPLAGRGFDAPNEPIEGLPVVGLLGMDFLLAKPSILDVAVPRLTRLRDFPEQRVVDELVFDLAFDVVQDHALVPVTIDGQSQRLMFDTAGGHTLWVGQPGRPGDRVEYVQDFEGNVFPIYVGTATVSFESNPERIVPSARAPEFPYFADTVRALGGNIHGLLGVSTFDQEALLFSGARQRLYVLRP